MLYDTVQRLIRTYVPAGVAWLIGVGVLPADLSAEATVTVTALVFGGYYLAAAALEQYVWSGFGWLLGVPKDRQPAEKPF
jgi:hypothetical protein